MRLSMPSSPRIWLGISEQGAGGQKVGRRQGCTFNLLVFPFPDVVGPQGSAFICEAFPIDDDEYNLYFREGLMSILP